MNSWQGMTLITCLIWGIWPVFLKQAQREGAPTWGLIYAMVLAEVVALSLVGLVRGGAPFSWSWGRWAILTGLVGVLSIYTFARALSLGSTGTVTGLSIAYPVVTIAIAWVFLQEKVGGRELAGIALCIAGAMMITWNGNG